MEWSGNALVQWANALTPEEWQRSPDGGWSLHQVLAHLRDTEALYLERARRIRKEEHPAIANFDQEAHMREHYDPATPVKTLIAEFRAARRAFVRLLRALPDKDWERSGVHADYGPISLEWLATHEVGHTFEHLAHLLYARDVSLLPMRREQA